MSVLEVTNFEKDKGSDAPAHASAEMANLIYELSPAMIVVQQYKGRDLATMTQEERLALRAAKKELRSMRRKIRYRLFRIRDAVAQNRDPSPEYDQGLKAWIELQFQPGMAWIKRAQNSPDAIGGFTFEWDVAAYEPLRVIKPFQWDGDIERGPGPQVGQTIDRCDPAAFTQQG